MENLLQNIFPGISQMANIHPLLVHFPIALLNGFFIMELFGLLLKKEELGVAATWMLYLGTLGALAAVSAGLWAAGTVPHGEEVHAIMTRHRNLGITVLALGSLLSVWRIFSHARFSLKARIIHLVLAFITVITMAFGADLGGLMVYKYGVAVKAVPQPEGHIRGGKASAAEEGQTDGNHSNKDHGHEMQHGD